MLELSGVFGGALSRASSAAIRAVNVPICAAWTRTRATRSAFERARRVSRSTDTVNRTVRDRVKHNVGRRSGYAQGGEQLHRFQRLKKSPSGASVAGQSSGGTCLWRPENVRRIFASEWRDRPRRADFSFRTAGNRLARIPVVVLKYICRLYCPTDREGDCSRGRQERT